MFLKTYVYVCFEYMCLYTLCVPGAQGGQKRVQHPLYLELETVYEPLCVKDIGTWIV